MTPFNHFKNIKCILFLLTCFFFRCSFVNGQESMAGSPFGSYTYFFRYFTPGDVNNPVGSNMASNAIIGMASFHDANPRRRFPLHSTGTGFLINTYRKDKKICMCTNAHVVDALFGNAAIGSTVAFDAHMKYLERHPLLILDIMKRCRALKLPYTQS